ncbi:MAG: DUF1566 domain-containing protein [Deltaproteobacteria bacterium]|nr:DUF1566 domain-containing protein [Deltaproteobacteria bacterium]
MSGKKMTLLLLIMLGTIAFQGLEAATLPPPPPAALSAAFTVSPSSPMVNQMVQFKDTGTGKPYSWAWNFGDGTTSSIQNPGHAYSLAGTFTVTLKAGNGQGSSTVSKPLIVKIAPPTAGISFSPSLPYIGQAVAFTDTSTGKPTSWAWNFGDGSTSTSQNPTHTYSTAGTYTVTLVAGNAGGSSSFVHALTVSSTSGSLNYPTVDTGQAKCYNTLSEITPPGSGQNFYGQDAQFSRNQPSYTLSSDGLTVYDNVTGLTWQRSPDTNGNGAITSTDKMTYAQAQARPATLNAAKFGGYADWRLPTIKELYSLIDFRGTDPSGYTGTDTSGLTPFINTNYFKFAYGQISAGERIIDSQYASATLYVVPSSSGKLFGVNFADGRIKGYDLQMPGSPEKTFFVLCVRGNPSYGVNNFLDNGNQTVTDKATGLMWSKGDSGSGMNWEAALAWVQTKNAANYLGHNDWRLPNAKELQSIVDYTRSPDTTGSAAVDSVFTCTSITDEGGYKDYPYFWTGTTHAAYDGTGGAAVYLSFGRALGWMQQVNSSCYTLIDIHGAGAQRSDPKTGSPTSFYLGTACSGGPAYGHGPQGDIIRISNYVRLVRTVQ